MNRSQPVALTALFASISLSCAAMRQQVQPARQGSFPMIDVTGKTKSDAEAAIRSYGITGTISVVDNHVCDDPNVHEGLVCYTAPRSGTATSSRIPVTLYLRPTETRTYVMPDLRGKTVDEAKQILIGLGQQPERFVIEEMRGWLDECQPSRVCRQSPAPGQKTAVTIAKWLDIAPATRPMRPTPPPPPREPGDSSPEPPAPKPQDPPPPEPIF